MSFLRNGAWVLGAFIGAGCSGSDTTAIGNPDAAADGGADASTGPDATSDAPVTADGAGSDGNGGTDANDNDSGFTDSGACPDEHGKYTVVRSGQGCGDLAASAPQCIQQSVCAATFVSNGTAGGGSALNGTADLALDGSFGGAAIREGTANRTGCVGAWNAATSTLTVDCGGTGTSQSCRATLTRVSAICN